MSDHAGSDESLLIAAGRGNLKSFGRIVQRHQTRAWSVAVQVRGRGMETLADPARRTNQRMNEEGQFRNTQQAGTILKFLGCLAS